MDELTCNIEKNALSDEWMPTLLFYPDVQRYMPFASDVMLIYTTKEEHINKSRLKKKI